MYIEIAAFVFYTILFLLLGSFFMHAFRLLGRRQGAFGCLQCGKCCTLEVTPKEADIRRIERAGYRRRDFMDGGNLKRVNGACTFLEKKGALYHCGIHAIKPGICRKWPFSGIWMGRFVLGSIFNCPGMGKRWHD